MILYPCPADIEPYCTHGDNLVGADDLLAVINSWGICTEWPDDCRGDVTPSPCLTGVVDVADLLFVINHWGPCPNPGDPLAPPGWRFCLFSCESAETPEEYEQCVAACRRLVIEGELELEECINAAIDECGTEDPLCIVEYLQYNCVD